MVDKLRAMLVVKYIEMGAMLVVRVVAGTGSAQVLSWGHACGTELVFVTQEVLEYLKKKKNIYNHIIHQKSNKV